MVFKKWVKNRQTVGYNGDGTVHSALQYQSSDMYYYCNLYYIAIRI